MRSSTMGYHREQNGLQRCPMKALFLAFIVFAAAAHAAPGDSSSVAEPRAIAHTDAQPIGRSPTVVIVAPGNAVCVAGAVDIANEAAAARERANAALERAMQYVRQHGLGLAGPPLVVNRHYDGQRWDFEVMVPIRAPEIAAPTEPGISLQAMPSGLAVAIDHVGPVETLHRSYSRIAAETPAGLRLQDLTWEQYLDDPDTTPSAGMRIRVFRAARR